MNGEERSRLRRALFAMAAVTVVAAGGPVAAAPVAGPVQAGAQVAEGGSAPGIPGCVEAPLALAARALVHDRARVEGETPIAGLQTALVTEPTILPGVRHRLVRSAAGWCDATGFNAAWADAGGGGDVATASAYARVVSAPYFDQVTVRAARSVAAGVVQLDTHAVTNGVTAAWTVIVDRAGVKSASWTSTAFAVAPFVPQVHGLTALPGVVRSYTRQDDGALLPNEPLIQHRRADPTLTSEVRMPDGFTVEVLLSQTSYGPDLGMDTGVTPVDFVRIVRDTAEDNYRTFLGWGLEKRWASNMGAIYVDTADAATCFACVYIAEPFNIHISTQVRQVLLALGYSYPDASDRDVLSLVLGHEMFHNFQIAYAGLARPEASWSVAFGEGTARMQEALHDYSAIGHQPGSLIYARDPNGCNGWNANRGQVFIAAERFAGPITEDSDAAMAEGPFADRSYDACYFWLTFQGARGTPALVGVLGAMYEFAPLADPTAAAFAAVEQVTGESIAVDLANFAAAALTGHGYTFPAGDGTGEALDWSVHLDRWQVPVLATGGTVSRQLANGGMFAAEIATGGEPTVAGAAAQLFVVRSDATGAQVELFDDDDVTVAAPGAGERVWLVAVRAELSSGQVTLRLALK